jgi:hypothetical protein
MTLQRSRAGRSVSWLGVAWAAFEMPKSGPVYRAGIEFYDAEAGNVERFIDTNKVS